MTAIRDISLPAEACLQEIPLEMWTLSHDGGYLYGVRTTNMAECFNNNVNMARFMPVSVMVEYIFYRMVKLFNERLSTATVNITNGHNYCIKSRKNFKR